MFGLVLLATLATSGMARAADTPLLGPAPAWVRPVEPAAIAAKTDDVPMRILLSDQQVALEPGRQTAYSNVVVRIETPQGLAAGNISFAWRPETDVLTVHRLHIRRGDRVIDVLGSGQTFTVARRETNLERATLDGVLTANIQPEGLQVGDVVDFASSVTSSDPTLKSHVEQIAATWNGFRVGKAHLRIQWPSSLNLRLRQDGALPVIKPVKAGSITAIELSLDNLEPIAAPRGAPRRFAIGRLLEASDFASWAELGALMAPLYAKAATLPDQGQLRDEVERIRTASGDPKARAEAALGLVQDRVRYVALQMGQGGLVPADAETTWSRRFGDCKGKTALLIAILHALDIEAVPVLVNTAAGDGLDRHLPMVGLFDHVLVRATVTGRSYWLDGTRAGDASLDRIEIPRFEWGLPVLPSGAALIRIMPPAMTEPNTVTTIRMDASEGISIPAPTKIETVFKGDQAQAINASLANLSGDARDRALREYWRSAYDFIDPQSVSATFDAKAGTLSLALEGKARMDWSSGYYETDGMGVGYRADFHREPGPNHDAPFAVAFPYFTKSVETIMLPRGFGQADIGTKAEVDQTVAGIEYKRHASLVNNVYTIETTERSVAAEFPFSEAPQMQAALRELAGRTVYLRRPAAYEPTRAELAAATATEPKTAAAFLERGRIYMQSRRYLLAVKDFDSALALGPNDGPTLADRGITRVWIGDYALASRDFDAALAADPRNIVAIRGRGLMAERQRAWQDAIAGFTRALALDADDQFSLGHRALAYNAIGDSDAALRDAASALAVNPNWIDLYLLRASLLRRQGKPDLAAREAEAVVAANPDVAYARVAAANIYNALGKTAEAMREYDRALALQPEAYIYLNRADARQREDLAGRRADIDEALKLQPGMIEAMIAKGELQAETGDRKGAIATFTAAIGASSDNAPLLNLRGIQLSRNGDQASAARDFSAARAKVSDATGLNNLCWAKATAGVGLEAALDDCNAALLKAPDQPAYLDSRGLVLLRLGRFDQAIADYDKALAAVPTLAPSLYGRAVAWARKGNKAKSDTDLAAALAIDDRVRRDFERYGVTP